jgi:hypothetical protein
MVLPLVSRTFQCVPAVNSQCPRLSAKLHNQIICLSSRSLRYVQNNVLVAPAYVHCKMVNNAGAVYAEAGVCPLASPGQPTTGNSNHSKTHTWEDFDRSFGSSS